MKLTIILITLAALQVSARSNAQNISLREQNAPLVKVLHEVERQSGYVLFFNSEWMKNSNPVNVNIKGLPLKEALEACFKKQPFDFVIVNKTIVVRQKVLPSSNNDHFILPSSVEATTLPQEIVQGRVTDSAGNPIPNVTVLLKGTIRGTVTDADGQYKLSNIDAARTVLVFSYVGYETREVVLNGRTEINITLSIKLQNLEEVGVSVNTGYQSIPKERATGSYGVITAKELEQVPTTNIMERLEGRIAGMDVNSVRDISTNKVKSDAITIRGRNNYITSGATTTPLVVVDGVPYYQYGSEDILSSLNPESIEQITVLKDAGAASIWGAQAANGVIVVTTKKGNSMEPKVNFSSTFSITGSPKLNKIRWMTSAQTIDYEQELIDKGRILDPTTASYKYYQNVSQAETIMFNYKNGKISLDEKESQLEALAKIDNFSKIKKYLLQSAATQQYNLSISGGSKNSSYFISGYYASDRPIYRSNTSRIVNLNINNDFRLFKNRIQISTGVTVNNTHDRSNSSALNATGNGKYSLHSYDQLKNADGTNKQYYLAYTPAVIDSAEALGYLKWTYSPVDELNYSNTISDLTTLRGKINIAGTITDWLKLEFLANYEKRFDEQSTYNELESYAARNSINYGTTISSTTGKFVYGIPNSGGNITTTNNPGNTYSFRFQTDVNKNWNGIHQFNFIAGAEVRRVYSKIYSDILYGYNKALGTFTSVNPTDYYYPFTSPTYASAQIGAVTTSITENVKRFLSYYGNASYGVLNKYFVSGSARFDDYNMLGVSRRNRAKPLWSTGVRWDLQKENFFKNINWIDQLSVRATYGFTGTLNPDATTVPILTVASTADATTNQQYATIYTPANPNLGWETTKQMNYGLDFSVFKHRLYGSLEYYTKRTKDIIASVPYNSTYGWSTLTFNTGKTKGHGFDISLNGVPISTNSFTWTTTLNFSYTTNKVTDSRFDATSLTSSITSSSVVLNGYPSDYLMVYRWAGLDSTGQSQVYAADGTTKVNSKTSLTDVKALKYMGRRGDPYFGAWFNNFQYKSLTLGIQVMYFFGGHFIRPSITSSNYPTSTYSASNFIPGKEPDIARRWRNPGDETSTNVPGLQYVNSNSINRYTYSDINVVSSSHIRLQQISLSYELPSRFFKNSIVKGMSVSGLARDLGIIWRANKYGIDPRYRSSISSINTLPPSTNYVFRVSANL